MSRSLLSSSSRLSPPPLWLKATFLGLAYFLCAEASNYLSARGTPYVSFWLPAGLYIAVLLLNERRDWLWLVLAVFPANFAFDRLSRDTSLLPMLCFYGANTIQAVLGAWLVQRFIAVRPNLATLKEFVGVLGFAAVLSTAVGAAIGAGTLVAFGLSNSFAKSWQVWWGSTAMAVLILTPFIITWFAAPVSDAPLARRPKRWLEAIALLATLAALAWHLMFVSRGIESPNKGPLLLPLLWAGLRFGPRGAALASLALAVFLAFCTTQLFQGLTTDQIASGDYVLALQTSVAVMALMAIIPAIVLRERDLAMAKLSESEARYRNLTEAAFEGIAISENGRVLDVNEPCLQMFGCERGDMIGRQIVEMVAPESRASVAEAVRTGQETIYEHRLLKKDGSFFFAEARARVVRAGGRTLRMTALRDITERKQAEQALRESEEKYAKAFRNSPDAVTISRAADGRIIEANEGFRRVFGYSPAEVVGTTSLELGLWKCPDDREVALREIQRVGFVRDWEFPFINQRRETGVALFSAERMEIRGESCLVSVVHDITERKQAEESLRQAQHRELRAHEEFGRHLLVAQEQERKRLAAELHDSLGQSLSLIKNRTHLALEQPALPDTAANHLQAINGVVSDAITEVRRLAHNLRPLHIEQLGLKDSLMGLLDQAAESTNIRLDHRVEDVDDLFQGEAATHVYRMVQEALNNLIKHSRATHASVVLERDIHCARLLVNDDGCGFDMRQGGFQAGLGLTSIRERARMLGGTLEVRSAPGQGTNLTIELRIAEGARPPKTD